MPVSMGPDNPIRKGVKWVLTGTVSYQILNFAIGVVLARLLLPEHFGLLLTVQVFTGVAGFFTGGGMGQALVQAKTLTKRDTHVVFSAQLFIGVLLYVVFFYASPIIAGWFQEPLYEELLRVSALTFLIRPFYITPAALLHRAMRYRAKAFINVAVLLATGSTSILLALYGAGVWSLVFGGLVGAASNVVLARIIANWKPRWAVDRRILQRLGSYGIKAAAVDLAFYLRVQVLNLIISKFLGPAALGLFNKGNSLRAMPVKLISGSVRTVVFRALSKSQDDLGQSRYIYLRTIALVTVYSFPALIGLWWVAEPFILTVYGDHWVGAAAPMKVLLLVGLMAGVGGQSGAVLAARGLLGRQLLVELIALLFVCIGALYAYQWGIVAIAWVVVLVSTVTTIVVVSLALRALRVSIAYFLRALTPALMLNGILMGTLLGLHVYVFQELHSSKPAAYLLGMASLGGLVYVGCFLYLPIPQLKSEVDRWKKLARLS